MSSNFESAPPTGDAPSDVNDAWCLHSGGRRFGPLSEDEMRGYFRAGMVKSGDLIEIPGQVGSSTAADVAKILQVAPPVVSAAVAKPIPPQATLSATHAASHETGLVNGWLASALAVVTILALAYFGFSGRLTPDREARPTELAQAPQPVVEQSAPPQLEQELSTPIETAVASGGSVIEQPTVPEFAAPLAQPVMTPIATTTQLPVDAAPKRMADTWYTEASRLANRSKWSELLAHSEKWTVAEPSRDLPWWFLGMAHSHLGNYPDAISALERALSITPSHFGVRIALAHVYTQSHRYRESANILNELVKEEPGNTINWINLGIATAQIGEYDESVAALDRAVKLEPRNRLAWYHLGRTYSHFGYLDKAKDAYATMKAIR